MRVVADWLCQRGFPVEYMGPAPSTCTSFLIHDSLHEPTNGWGLLDPVKRELEGVKRHSLCDII